MVDESAELTTRLDALIAEPAPDALRALLDSLDGEGVKMARRWFAGLADLPFSGQPRGGGYRDLNERSDVTMLLLHLGLQTPKQALDHIDFYGVGSHRDLVVARVLARGRDWVVDFVRVAGELPLLSGWQAIDTGALYQVVRTLCDQHRLPMPVGETLVNGWMAACTAPREWASGKWTPADPVVTLELVRADGRYAERVPHALAHRSVSDFPAIRSAVVSLVGTGDLDRADVLTRCLGELDSPGRPSHQQALAEILVGIGLRADEVPGGLPRLQQLMATCHGSVTASLLPLAVELLATREDVADLTSTIAARPEKKQRAELLRSLTATKIEDRLGPEAVRAGLEILADNADGALAGKARTALGKLGGSAPPTATGTRVHGLWDLGLEHTPATDERLAEIDTFGDEALRVILTASTRGARPYRQPADEPLALSMVVRWAAQGDLDAVRGRIASSGASLGWYTGTWLGRLLPGWLDGSLAEPGERDRLPVFAGRHQRECLLRAGRIPFLLSTPSRPDGTLDLDVLVDRLRASAEVGFGPLDLLQAMLRLRPVDPARAAELDGLPVVPADPTVDTTGSVLDAAAYLRDAVAAGRLLPEPITAQRMRDEGWLDHAQPPDSFWVAMLPADPTDLGSSLDELTAPGVYRNGEDAGLWYVAPWYPDLRLVGHLWQAPDVRAFRPEDLGGSGPLGVAVHDWLLREYADERPATRQNTVTTTLAWIAAQRWTPTAGVAAAAGRLAHGRLNLSRCSQAWEQIFLAGGLRAAWPVALGTAAQAAQQPRKPTGLADLLRMLTGFIPEVPDPVLPEALAALAAEKGSTKSHAEARLLAAAALAPRS